MADALGADYHARLSPSGADRWMTCPGSVKQEEKFPDVSSAAAEEGTQAHDVAERYLKGEIDSYEGWDLQVYFDHIEKVRSESSDTIQELIEYRVFYDNWVPEGSGTADYILLDFDQRHIDVIDLKYGQGVKVFADNNSQGKLYLAGAYQEFDFLADFKTMRFTIVQPRMDHIDSVEYEVPEIIEFAEAAGKVADLIYSDADLPLNPSEKACQWCRAKGVCTAQAEFALAIAKGEFDVIG